MQHDSTGSDNEPGEGSLAVVQLRQTPIGQGVFALRKLRRGVVIGEVAGQVIDDPNHSSDYCIDLGNDYSLEPTGPFRFLNHSCHPNAELFQFDDQADPLADRRMWVHSIRKIRPGDQITIDYSWPAHSAIVCHCESKKCRGWIVDRSELKWLKRSKKKLKKRKKN